MFKRGILGLALVVGGCAMLQPRLGSCTLILKPQISTGQLTQTVIAPYDKAAIQHLTLKIFIGAQDTGLTKTLLNAQLDNPVVFSNLKDHTTYRVKAYAYASTDDTTLISFDDANSWTDITLTDDDRPTVTNLKVKLVDKLFNGQATSSLTVNPGVYSPIATEGLAVPRVVTTLAGSGVFAFADGMGTSASFSSPYGISVDSQGNVYVADYNNNRIRKIYPSGLVTTLAGWAAGTADGTGTSASFYGPRGLTIDAQGNLYVSDSLNNRIRKVTSSGVVTTIAGSGSGFANGTGTAALFNFPQGLAVDPSGNLYVADANNHRVRKIASGGIVSTVAGNDATNSVDGVGTAASFNVPAGIALDASNKIYVSDHGSSSIRVISTGGVVSTYAGGGTVALIDGVGTSAAFVLPWGLSIGAYGDLYVADYGGHCIRKVDAYRRVTTIAGSSATGYADGTGSAAIFYKPVGLTVDANGNIFVADWNGTRIRKIQ